MSEVALAWQTDMKWMTSSALTYCFFFCCTNRDSNCRMFFFSLGGITRPTSIWPWACSHRRKVRDASPWGWLQTTSYHHFFNNPSVQEQKKETIPLFPSLAWRRIHDYAINLQHGMKLCLPNQVFFWGGGNFCFESAVLLPCFPVRLIYAHSRLIIKTGVEQHKPTDGIPLKLMVLSIGHHITCLFRNRNHFFFLWDN